MVRGYQTEKLPVPFSIEIVKGVVASILGLLICVLINGFGFKVAAIILAAALALLLVIKTFQSPKFGLYLLIANIPLNQYFPLIGIGSDNLSVSVQDVLVALVLVSWIIGQLFDGKLRLRKSPLNQPLIFFIATTLLSLIISILSLEKTEFLVCLLFFLLWVEYLIPYFLVVHLLETREDIEHLVKVIIWTAVLVTGTALYQHISGMPLEDIGFISPGGKVFYRLSSFFPFNSNDLGTYLVIVLSLILAYRGSYKRIAIQHSFWILFLPIFYVLIFTFSRSSYIGFIALTWLLAGLEKDKRRFYFLLGLLLLLGILLTPVVYRFADVATFEIGKATAEINIKQRLAQWVAAWHTFWKHPIVGQGFYSFYFREVNIHTPFGFVQKIYSVHNYYLRVLIESGLLGFAAFLWVIKRFYETALSIYRKSQNDLARSLALTSLAAFTAVLATCLTGSMLTVRAVTALLWTLVGAMVVASRWERKWSPVARNE